MFSTSLISAVPDIDGGVSPCVFHERGEQTNEVRGDCCLTFYISPISVPHSHTYSNLTLTFRLSITRTCLCLWAFCVISSSCELSARHRCGSARHRWGSVPLVVSQTYREVELGEASRLSQFVSLCLHSVSNLLSLISVLVLSLSVDSLFSRPPFECPLSCDVCLLLFKSYYRSSCFHCSFMLFRIILIGLSLSCLLFSICLGYSDRSICIISSLLSFFLPFSPVIIYSVLFMSRLNSSLLFSSPPFSFLIF